MTRLIVALSVAVLAAACSGASESESPDGDPLEAAAFRASRGASYAIVLVGAGDPRVVVAHDHPAGEPLLFDRPSWSPDGSRLVVTLDRDRANGRTGARTDLFLIEVAGRRATQLTTTGRAYAPLWAPDGETIVFAQRVADGTWTSGLWSVDVDSGRLRQLLPQAPNAFDVPGSFAPDGSLLAFTRVTLGRSTSESRSAVLVVRRDGTTPRLLIQSASDPAWSPDGSRLAYVSDRDGNGRLSYGDRTFVANEL